MTERRTHATPDVWTAENQRMYEQLRRQHVHEGATEAGAHERAIREVNERRRERARSDSPRPVSPGRPDTARAGERSLDDLRAEARGLGVEDPLAMDRDDLVRAIADRAARTRRR